MRQVALDFSQAFGGESGLLWNTLISEAAPKLNKNLNENNISNWTAAYESGLKGLKENHKISVGERTMVDALEPGLEYILKQNAQNSSVDVTKLYDVIREGANSMQKLHA